MSAYRLLYTDRAIKDIQALDTVTRKRLGKKMLELAEDPIKRSVKLVNSDLGAYRFRVGDHRIIFDLRGKDIVVLRAGHRREIYRG